MNKWLSLIPLILIAGCIRQIPLELIVNFHATGCAGFNEAYSDVEITPSGLSIITNIISNHPCYTLKKAELVQDGNNLTLYFTLDEDRAACVQCIGLQTFIYNINGEGINRSGINIKVVTIGDLEVNHSFAT